MSDDSGDRFNDNEVKALIARALEFEVHGQATTAQEVREIAAEIGIAPDAVEAALQEHRGNAKPSAEFSDSRAGLAIAALGLPLGAAAGALLTGPALHIGLAVLGLKAAGLIGTGALIVTLGKRPRHRTFQTRNLLLWAGIGVGGLAATTLIGGAAALTGMIAGWSIRGWITSAVLGFAAVVAIRRISAPEDSSSDSPMRGVAHSERGGLRAIVSRVSEWFTRPLRRGRDHGVSRTAVRSRWPTLGTARNVSA